MKPPSAKPLPASMMQRVRETDARMLQRLRDANLESLLASQKSKLSLGKAALRFAVRWKLSVEEARVMLERALREHRLPIFSSRYAANLGIELLSGVDFDDVEDVEGCWKDSVVNPSVFVYAKYFEDWVKLNTPSSLQAIAEVGISLQPIIGWTREQCHAYSIWEDLRLVELVGPKDRALTVKTLLAEQKKALRPLYTERKWPGEVYGPSFAEMLPLPVGSIAKFERAVAEGRLVEIELLHRFDPTEVMHQLCSPNRLAPVMAPELAAPNETAGAAAASDSDPSQSESDPPPPSGIRSNRAERAENECRQWLKHKNPKDRPPDKEQAFEDTKVNIPHGNYLSWKTFERVWADEVPAGWKRPGRRKSPPPKLNPVRDLR
jgi:hypothetical protein